MPRSILVVEDEPMLVEVLTDVLTDEGCDVQVARGGVEAVAAIQRVVPDLLLTDIMMPRLDGFTLIQHIRDHGHHVPIVVMSAHAADMTAPGVRHLRKPFDLGDLLATITQLTDEQ